MGAKVYKLEVTVKNKGDDAYNAKLYVDIPKGISVRPRGVFRVEGDKVSCENEIKRPQPLRVGETAP